MSIGWKFSRSSIDEGRSGGNASEYAFDHDLKDFVRETLQNSNDAGQDVEGKTRVNYKLRELTGDNLSSFLDVLQWESGTTYDTLRDHMDSGSIANTYTTLGHVYGEIVDEDNARLLVVTVEDYNTHGLYGPEGGDGPFSALVLDELITKKEGGSGSGGSYGLGKAVLWSWSGLKTVIFSSNPDLNRLGGNEPPRLVARTQLPSHESGADAYRYEGRGLFGDIGASPSMTAVASGQDDVVYKWGDEGGRPYSVWGDESTELSEQLGMGRSGDEYGTSISILGFCEPGGNTQASIDEVAEGIAEEASKWFWPAMLQDTLEVTVETDNETVEVEADTCEAARPFINCVQKRHETREILEQPGDVSVRTPEFNIEDRDTSSVPEGEDPMTQSGPIAVYARLADPDDPGPMSNYVALIRGSGMVVKYYNRDRVVYGGRSFHGVALAGKARPWTDEEPTDADVDIDDYLKAAEPPRHNDWEYTKRLKSNYKSGSGATIKNLQRIIITDAIKDIVRQTREEGRLVAGRLANRLNIPEGKGEGGDRDSGDGGSGSQVFSGTSNIEFDAEADRWEFSGFATIDVDNWEAWEVEVELRMKDEENKPVGTVPIESGSFFSETDEIWFDDLGDTVTVRGGRNVSNFSFSGRSMSDPFRGETEVNVTGQIFLQRMRA